MNALIIRAMRLVSRHGVNPYHSHAAQSKAWKKAWTDKQRRATERAALRAERGYNPYNAI